MRSKEVETAIKVVKDSIARSCGKLGHVGWRKPASVQFKDNNVARRREGIVCSSREARQPSQQRGVQGRRCDPMLKLKTIHRTNQCVLNRLQILGLDAVSWK